MRRFPNRHLLTAIGLLWIGSAVSHAAPPRLPHAELADVGLAPDALSSIDDIVAEGLRDGKMPGAVVLVAHQGKVIFLKAYGNKRIEPAVEAMTTDTVFDMASITKPVATATSVMKLIEQGKLALDEEVAKYIPEFATNGKEELTLRDLLTHQSGLIPDNSMDDYKGTPKESFAKIHALPLKELLRTKFMYSDVNFITLGELVEVASGKNVNDFSRENIFAPLGMSESGYLPSPALAARAAPTEKRDGEWMQGSVHDPRAFRLGGIAGHAGLFSTAEDLAVYAQMMLGKGEYGGVRVLNPETVELMTRANLVPPRGRRGLGWDMRTGYSINRGDAMSRSAFGHGGFTGTVMWIDPELDLFFIFLSNRLHPDGKGAVNPLAGRIGTVASSAVRAARQSRMPAGETLTGLDVLVRDGFQQLKGRKVGLITNQTGIDRQWKNAVGLLHAAPDLELKILFSPEHGFQGKLDHENVAGGTDESTGLKIFSLYGETRTPTADSLEGLDTLVFDIQDIGARYYTYPSTMANAMQAAAKHKLKFVVLDRPNPINGVDVEGPILDDGTQSFVGFHTLPVRHGMTVGELATMFREETKLDVELEVIKVEGWNREDYFDRTGLPWINPSPNMRSLTEAVLYPAIGLLETTNLSVGRGTDRPFELLGAPWIDGVQLTKELNASGLEGVRFVPVRFTPNATKYANEECGGIDIAVVDREKLRPVRVGLTIAAALRKLYPNEWETKSFNRLLSNKQTYDLIVAGKSAAEAEAAYAEPLTEFLKRRQAFLLY
jgi:uncharacterized protein YbbC (DUF1343 family)/CubicO group peptidase (beta-lactamase class C family)